MLLTSAIDFRDILVLAGHQDGPPEADQQGGSYFREGHPGDPLFPGNTTLLTFSSLRLGAYKEISFSFSFFFPPLNLNTDNSFRQLFEGRTGNDRGRRCIREKGSRCEEGNRLRTKVNRRLSSTSLYGYFVIN
ncbi:hypothetical protein PUN28_018765 [Cardiocondyla obscurior]|uniref:Uncharacterized protein n=1 Tax=Cardiocondyla obscurior TaxID=286306 RepID=A0AAW2EFH9_9HYME